MKWRSPRFFLPVLLVVLLGIAGLLFYIHTVTSQEITVSWQVHPTLFTQQDQQRIQDALQSALRTNGPQGTSSFHFTIVSAKRQGEWATIDATASVDNSTTPLATEPLFAIAQQQGSAWSIWIENSPQFCHQLKQVPATLMDLSSKQYFIGCYR